MRNIFLIVSYDGTNFCGWQKQDNQRTVQGEIEKVLEIVHKTKIELYGSGRTDSGVHAIAQAANFFSNIDSIPVKNYPLALNSHLPKDIRIMDAYIVDNSFHARFSATRRTYRYFLHCGSTPFAHQMKYVWSIHRNPDILRLNRMSSVLHGEIDCAIFAASGDESKSTFRFIEHAIFFIENDKLVFEICANAFLWKMVRSIVGSLIYYEKQGMDKDDFAKIVASKNRSFAGPTAPPNGLFLWSVGFDGTRRDLETQKNYRSETGSTSTSM
ncbi:MAG: tRNA pseudouridine(38-40) synthase TruA [Treponema sp.]|nr:tRNA pseudouridine(38-40) synthase TruA [Treponema sp.]